MLVAVGVIVILVIVICAQQTYIWRNMEQNRPLCLNERLYFFDIRRSVVFTLSEGVEDGLRSYLSRTEEKFPRPVTAATGGALVRREIL
jgi:hypothetical protein